MEPHSLKEKDQTNNSNTHCEIELLHELDGHLNKIHHECLRRSKHSTQNQTKIKKMKRFSRVKTIIFKLRQINR